MKSIPYADKMPDESLLQYFMRLLATVIHSTSPNQEIRIPIQDLIECEGAGIIKRWDPIKRELVLTFASASTEAFFKPQAKEPQAQQLPQSPQKVISMPHSIAPDSGSPGQIGEHVDIRKSEHIVRNLLSDAEIARQERLRLDNELAKGSPLDKFKVR